MKIAVFGGSGLLGSNLIKLYNKYDVVAFSRKHSENVDSKKTKIINFDNLEEELIKHFDHWKPDLIINAIAIVNLQKCEDDFQLAYFTNVKIAERLAMIAKKNHSYFVHISTDHYYNDSLEKHNEKDPVTLMNNYARTKYAAELAVSATYNSSLIIRTNIVGFRKNNLPSFFEWLISSLKNKESIKLFTDFITSPVSVIELGRIILKLYEMKSYGVFNVASRDAIDKYGFGLIVSEKFSMDFSNVTCDTISGFQSKNAVKRAINLGLDITKVESELGVDMPTIQETVQQLYNEYRGLKNEL